MAGKFGLFSKLGMGIAVAGGLGGLSTLDFDSPEGFFGSLTDLPQNMLEESVGTVGSLAGSASKSVGSMFEGMMMPLMLVGGGLVVLMILKK